MKRGATYLPFQLIPSIGFIMFGLFTFVISIVFGADIKILTDSNVVNSLTRISKPGP
jgi:hypothetical protein